MAMKKCPDCNQKYSDTYKKCPFCEEEKKIQKGKRIRKRNMKNGRRTAGSDRENLLTLVLLIIMLVLAGILLWLLFGGGGGDLPGGKEPSSQSGETSKPGTSEPGGTSTPGGTSQSGSTSQPGGTSTPGGNVPEAPLTPTAAEIKQLPENLKLNKADYTTKPSDAPVTLKVTGGTGVYTWVSEDPRIATVDSNGKVTAVANGNVWIYATDGESMGKCIVRVKGGSAPASGGTTTPTTPTTSDAKLSKTDITIKVGDITALKVKNYEGTVTWSVDKADVVSVLNDGTVKGLKVGNAKVTAKAGDVTLTCIVRVKN